MKKNRQIFKKLLLCLLVCVQLVLLVPVVFAAGGTEAKSYAIPYADTAITVDGTAGDGEAWSLASWEPLYYYDGSSRTGTFSARFKALWREDGLYFLVDVTDAEVDIRGAEWYNDIVRLFVEESGAGSGTTENGGYKKSTNMAAGNIGSLQTANPYTYFAQKTPTGYTVEAKYAFSNTAYAVADHTVRMEVHAVDHKPGTGGTTGTNGTINEQHYWNSTKGSKADGDASLAGKGVLLSPAASAAFRPQMQSGAGVRLDTPTGLRFETRIDKAAYDALVSDGATLETGTVILPTDSIPSNGIITKENLDAENTDYLDVVNSGWANADTAEQDGYYQYYGSIVDLKGSNYQRSFSAVSYLTVTKNGQTETYYSSYREASHSRSVAQVSILAVNSGDYDGADKAADKQLLQNYHTVKLNGIDLKNYRIVYGAGDPVGQANAEAIKTALQGMINATLAVVSDSATETAYEILIGSTNRAASKSLALQPMHYGCQTVGSKLVIQWYGESIGGREATFGGERMTEAAIKALHRYGNDWTNIQTEASLFQSIPTVAADAYRFMQYNVLVEYENWGSDGTLIKYGEDSLKYRAEGIAGMILDHAPDVAVLCEMFPVWSEILPELLADKYAIVNQFRTNSGDLGDANRTVIVYDREKFELVESGYQNLPSEDTSTGKNANYRVVTWAVLEDKTTGQKTAVFGTHWDGDAGESRAESRLTEGEKMAEKINAIKEKYSGIPVVAMGDFNCRVSTNECSTFMTNAGLSDGLANVDGHWIDHVLYSGGTVLNAGMENGNYTEYFSDHKPVWCDIKFN